MQVWKIIRMKIQVWKRKFRKMQVLKKMKVWDLFFQEHQRVRFWIREGFAKGLSAFLLLIRQHVCFFLSRQR